MGANTFFFFKILLIDVFGNYELSTKLSTKFSQISVISGKWQFRQKKYKYITPSWGSPTPNILI